MAITNWKRWNARLTWQFGSGPEIEFFGRKPTVVTDGRMRDELFALGVFKRVGDNALAYCGCAEWTGKSGRKYRVDDDGLALIDFTDMETPRADLEKELEDPTDEELARKAGPGTGRPG